MLQIRPNDITGVSDCLKELEQQLGIVFPDDYKQFLIKYNGGWTPNTTIYFRDFSFGLNSLYGVGRAKNTANINFLMNSGVSVIVDEFFESLLDGFFTIGDWFGSRYYIGVNPNSNEFGTIYYMNEDRQGYCFVASSFKDFVYLAKTPNFYVGCVEENIEYMNNIGWGKEIDEELINHWQERYEKYKDLKLEPVILD